MNIKKFIHRRKEVGYSQIELSKGICTQSTLSKFECNGKIPSLVILDQLCQRLGLTIDDLNDDDSSSPGHLRRLLDEVEQELMMEHFQKAIGLIKKINSSNLLTSQDQMQYYYLEGMIKTLTNAKASKILFNFSKILDQLDERHQTIYSQMAYLGSGILCVRQNDMKHVDFFFDKVIAYLQKNARNDWAHVAHQYYLRIIMMTYYAAEYHALNHRFMISNRVLKQVIGMCEAQQVTFFMPRIKLLAANNAIETGRNATYVRRLLTEAMVFACFNHNSVVKVQVAVVRKQFEDKIVNAGN